jgi:hypothetical protein
MGTLAQLIRSVHAWSYGHFPDSQLKHEHVGPAPSSVSDALGMSWQEICRFSLAVDAWQCGELSSADLEASFTDLVPAWAVEYAFAMTRRGYQ